MRVTLEIKEKLMQEYPDDRRKSLRGPGDFQVLCSFAEPLRVNLHTATADLEAKAMDISDGGIGLEVSMPLAKSSRVRMLFTITNRLAYFEKFKSRKFQLSGEVRYCNPLAENQFRAGVLFLDISREEAEFIREYAKDHQKKH